MTLLDRLRASLGDRYSIEAELGRGGMGAVYLARDRRLDRPVALKVLTAEMGGLRERFLRETVTAAGFSHPNIVPVYAVEEAGDILAYAMAYVEGETLAERVGRAGVLSPREIVKLLQDVAYALAYAHGRGVVHRDIKPENIMIERATGRALVMDFGIARPIQAPAADASLTRVGEVVGTPEYMSPEQATGDVVDGRSDLYSLGLTAHFALTGRPAISGETTGRILARQIAEELPPIAGSRPDLPEALAAAIDRCVEKDPAARYPSAEALVEELDEARLTPHEIPIAVRAFGHELNTLTLLTFGALVLAGFLVRGAIEQRMSDIDTMLPLVLIVGVIVTRFLQTFSEAVRIARAGFTPEEVERGLSGVMDERQGRRDELRGDPQTARARRRTLIIGWLLLALAAALIRGAFLFRTQVAPRMYDVAPQGVVLVFSGIALLGISLVLILRSPFRMPVGERVFRAIWLGPVGRGFFAAARRSAGRQTSLAPGRVRATPEPTRPGKGRDASTPQRDGRAAEEGQLMRIAALEERVSRLEQLSGRPDERYEAYRKD